MAHGVELSIVVPVFNEEEVLPDLYKRLKAVCEAQGSSYEIVFVDDGSSDDSVPQLIQMQAEDPAVRVIQLTRNFGQQAAVLAGFRNSRGEIIVQLDSDLQHPPEEIPKLISAMKDDVDLVTTVSRVRRDSQLRVWGSRFLKWIGRSILGKRCHINLSSFRAMRRSVIEKVDHCSDRSRYMAVLMSWLSVPTVEIEVEHHQRQIGQTKYSILALISLAWDMVTGYSSFPLRLVTYLGFGSAVLGFLLVIFLLYQRFYNGILIEGFILLSAIFSFFAGVHLFCMGILGEYLSRIHFQVQGRPSYVIEKIIES